MPGGLRNGEITRIVNRYIGVSGGYLGDFSYRTHADFYPEFCNLDIDPNDYEGTTRERFIAILSPRSPADQAKILRGIIERCPPDEGPPTRKTAHGEVLKLIERMEARGSRRRHPADHERGRPPGAHWRRTPHQHLRPDERRGPGPHRAPLHGYLQAVCDGATIAHQRDDFMVALLRKLRTDHPKLQDLGPRAQDVEKVLNACGAILDALLPVRNRASVAHPNRELLGEHEVRLVINAGRTILHYLDAKLS